MSDLTATETESITSVSTSPPSTKGLTTVNAASNLHAFVGAVTIILMWLSSKFGLVIPVEIAIAIQTVLSVSTHYLVSRDHA